MKRIPRTSTQRVLRPIAAATVAVLVFSPLAGCGGHKSTGAASGPPHAVSKASQLVGTWYRGSDGPFAGLEFMKDGTVIVAPANSDLNSGITMRYKLLDGGRLSLIQPNGRTMILQTALSGDKLGLGNGQVMGRKGFQGFRRLKSGETLAQAAQAERAAKEKAREKKAEALRKRVAAVGKLLTQPKLAIFSADPKLNLDRMTLDLTGANGHWSGTALVEAVQGKMVLRRRVQVGMQSPAADGQPYRLVVQFGSVIGPPGTQQIRGESMAFAVRGTPEHPKIENGARVLKPDAGTYDSLTASYNEIVARRQAIIAKFADRFGSFTRLDGTLRYVNNRGGEPRRQVIGLLRVQGKPAFLWTDMTSHPNPGAADFNRRAGVVLDGDTPWLNIQGVGAVKAVTAGGKTTLQGRIQNASWDASYTLGLTLSKDELVRRRAAVAEFFDKTMSAAAVGLSGAYTSAKEVWAPVYPVHFDLKSDGHGHLSGDYVGLPWTVEFPVTGKVTQTLLGAHVEIAQGRQGVNGSGKPVRGRGLKWVFDVDWNGVTFARNFRTMHGGPLSTFKMQWKPGEPAFSGTLPGHSIGNRFDLYVDSPERLRSERRHIDKLLAAGLTLDNQERYSGSNSVLRKLRLQSDAAGGSIEVAAFLKARHGFLQAPATARELADHGFVAFDIREPAMKSPAVSARRVKLWAFAEPQGLLLEGFYVDTRYPEHVVQLGFWSPVQ